MTTWLPREIIAPVSDVERDAVRVAQRALGVPVTGEMDDTTRGALRGIQALRRLPVTGHLDRATAAVIESLRPPHLEGQ